MRRILLGVLFVSLCFATSAIGQAPRRLAAPIYGFIDSPSQYEFTPYTADLHIDGWAFDCRSGQQPPFVAVADHDMGQQTVTWLTSYTLFRDLARPDVRTAYAPACPNVTANSGYAIYPNTPLGQGVHFLTVFWTTGDGLARSTGIAVVVP